MSESGSALSYYGHGFGGGGEGHGAGGEGGEGVGRLLEEIVERDGIAQIDPVDVLVSGDRTYEYCLYRYKKSISCSLLP